MKTQHHPTERRLPLVNTDTPAVWRGGIRQTLVGSCGNLSTKVLARQAKSDTKIAQNLGMRDLTQIVSRNLKHFRTLSGLTQTALAKRSGVSQTAISAIERPMDSKSPTIDTVEALASALGLPAWSLLIDCDDMTPDQIQHLNGLIVTYASLTNDGRHQIERVAEAEARYAKAS